MVLGDGIQTMTIVDTCEITPIAYMYELLPINFVLPPGIVNYPFFLVPSDEEE